MYSTDEICQEVRNCLIQCQKKFYNTIKGDNPQQKQLSKSDKKNILLNKKVTPPKFVKVVEYWSERMKKVVKRQLAIV